MVVRKTVSGWIFDVCNHILMIILIAITLYPFLYIVNCSFSNSNFLIGDKGFMLLPQGFNLNAYQMVFKNPNIQSGYLNTLFIVVVGTTINIFMTSIGAFLLTRKNFAIKNAMAYMMIFTMYFSGGMIPAYILINSILKMGNSLWALIIPVSINTYNLIIMRTNFANIPESIEESARIDGANEYTVLFKIVLPLSIPIIAVMVLFYGVQHWNSWFTAMLYIRQRVKFPLQLILREILLLNSTGTMTSGASSVDKFNIGESIKYATIVVATIPILCVYPFIQRYFVKGIMIGAVKE